MGLECLVVIVQKNEKAINKIVAARGFFPDLCRLLTSEAASVVTAAAWLVGWMALGPQHVQTFWLAGVPLHCLRRLSASEATMQIALRHSFMALLATDSAR